MDLFDIAAVLIVGAALAGWLNARTLRLEPSVGLLVISLTASLAVMLLQALWPEAGVADRIRGFVADIDFNRMLMHGMLGFLLFAGALHVDLGALMNTRWTIGLLATFGLLTSTLLVAAMSKGIFALTGHHVDWLPCLVFGALISPTDPIAVMGILKNLHAPESLEAKIAGESLFNDGVAVVVFTALAAMLPVAGGHGGGHHGPEIDPGGVALFFLQEAGGGVLLGLALGYLVYRLMASIDDYKVEVMLTLALVMGGYALGLALHVSGPLAMVVAGLFIGNRGKTLAMSDEVVDYLEKFWELLDEILNAVLFLLIGVEVLVVAFVPSQAVAGAMAVAAVLLARWISVSLPVAALRGRRPFSPGVVRILTWAGLRGGISVALALSLPDIPEKPLLLTCTYVVVLFSILVQGSTVKRVLQSLLPDADH